MKTTIFYPLIHPEQEVARGLTSSLQQKGEDIIEKGKKIKY